MAKGAPTTFPEVFRRGVLERTCERQGLRGKLSGIEVKRRPVFSFVVRGTQPADVLLHRISRVLWNRVVRCSVQKGNVLEVVFLEEREKKIFCFGHLRRKVESVLLARWFNGDDDHFHLARKVLQKRRKRNAVTAPGSALDGRE
jgi:hypothetical protein